jgi:trichothecene 3-O-acetyltransferase
MVGTFFMPSGVRKHVNLPECYVSNAVYQLAATLELNVLFSSSGLQKAAETIRHAITAVNSSLVSSYLAMVNKKWIDWRFLECASTTGVAMGTDWTSGELYEQDWGQEFGGLVRYRFPGESFNCIFPKLLDGSAELVLSVMPQEKEFLLCDTCFGKYL